MDFDSLTQQMLGSNKYLKKIMDYKPTQIELKYVSQFKKKEPEHYNVTKLLELELLKCRQKLKLQYNTMRLQIFISTVLFSFVLILILHFNGKLSDTDPHEKAYYLVIYLASSFLFAYILIFWLKRWTKKTFNILKVGIEQINKEMREKGVKAIKKLKNSLLLPKMTPDTLRNFCLVQVMEEVHSVEMTQ